MTTMALNMRTPNVTYSLLLCWLVLSLKSFCHEVAASSSEAAESSSTASSSSCACGASSSLILPPRPDVSAKAETARWMTRVLDWGTLSTISTRLGGDIDGDRPPVPVPFGNVYSFVDGTCDKSTGVPYIYGTYLDQTFIDTKQNTKVSLTLSEASLSSVCTAKHGLDSCTLGMFC